MSQKLVDETGHRYGTLTVIEKTKNIQGRTAWLCRCDCGRTKIVRGPDLRMGRITTCGKGCPLKHSYSYEDLTGQKFGKLNVIERIRNTQSDRPMWKCRCDCGNEVFIDSGRLKSGNTKSCGCSTSHFIAEAKIFREKPGTVYNYLKVIGPSTPFNRNGSYYWDYECLICGRRCSKPGIYVRSGNIQSCGCLRSKNEKLIEDFLQEQGIPFSNEYKFSDLLSEKGYPLRFDFALFQDKTIVGLIEYQGRQHFSPVDFGAGRNTPNEDFLYTQQHDRQKKEYCDKKELPLLYLKGKISVRAKKKILNFYNNICLR